jgi:hypothetical protein
MKCGFFFSFFLIVLSLSAGGCKKDSGESVIIPPPNNPLSREGLGYGVIIASYTQVFKEPGGLSAPLDYIRQGSIAPVFERKIIQEGGKGIPWVYIDGANTGWVLEANLRIYENESQARTASEAFLQ